MNPLVADMLFAQREDLELRNLEGLLNDDCKCETNHVVLPCTFKVTGVVTSTCNGETTLKCKNGIQYSQMHIANGGTCVYCDEPASDCWTIRPI